MKTEMIIKPKPKLRWMRCTLVENYDLTVRFSGRKEDWSESEFISGTQTRVLLNSIREQMEKIMIAHTKSI